MKLPRPRFSVRWLMVVVAIVGVGVGAYSRLNRRIERFRERARYHEAETRCGLAMGVDGICRAINRRGQIISFQSAQWHGELAIKYQFAASHPWQSVEPDPPEPK